MQLKTEIIRGTKFSFINEKEFIAIHKNIFIKKKFNHFNINSASPFILDCGAHIGISVLYFKKLFPKSKIIAFEPNPIIFKILEKNVKQNNLKDVVLVNAAVSNKKGEENFFTNKNKSQLTWGGAIVKNVWYTPAEFEIIKVYSVRLSSYIKRKIDLIKLNIEGAEGKVLREIENKLYKVKEIAMEFHGNNTNRFNNIDNIRNILERNSFVCMIEQKNKSITPEQIKREGPFWAIIHAYKM